MYTVELLPSAEKQLQKLPKHIQEKIKSPLLALGKNPRPDGVKKLKGKDKLWRIRVGDYRVIYEIHDAVLLVLVIRLGHRQGVYE